MTFYIGTPRNQLQAALLRDQHVLVSFALWSPFLNHYEGSFKSVLLDSGAYSEHTTGIQIDLNEYVEFAESRPWVVQWAGLDDISGDWRRSMKNYERGGFPTYHDTDPPELLPDLIQLARERGNWLGIGLKPPRNGRRDWLRRTLREIPSEIHVHGWALWQYQSLGGFSSFDSTHAWREWPKYRNAYPWLTPAECMEIAVKKCERLTRTVEPDSTQMEIL